MPGLEGKPWGYVAGTRLGKRYVSFYLMSVYGRAGPAGLDLAAAPEADAGQVVDFNFTKIDEPLFAELEALTDDRGIALPAGDGGRGARRLPAPPLNAAALSSRRSVPRRCTIARWRLARWAKSPAWRRAKTPGAPSVRPSDGSCRSTLADAAAACHSASRPGSVPTW